MPDEKKVLPFEGEAVRLGGVEYILPSLSVNQAKKHWEKIRGLNDGVTLDNVMDKHLDAVKVIHAALSRNYPDMTAEEVGDLVDLNNMRKLLMIVAATSGIKLPGGQPAGAEVAEPRNSIGAISTESSSPAPAGPLSTSIT